MKRGVVERPAAMAQPCPPPRAARKSEWLRSALAHHHSPQPGVENEIVVLATGIDQYLQEVFHHLAYPNQEDAVSAEDFTVLCAVLGLMREDGEGMTTSDAQRKEDIHEFQDVYAGLPCQLSFKDFHSRLCGFFRVRVARNGTGEDESSAVRLPVSDETELVEREIRLRWPRFRRRKCVSFNLAAKDQTSVRTVTKRSHKAAANDKESVPEEAAALRELVEDLRSALQGSDARCLALEVALRQERARNALNYTCSTTTDVTPLSTASHSKSPACTVGDVTTANSTTKVSLASQGRRRGVGGGGVARTASQRCDARDPILRELKLIRSSRDGQLEEAIKYNHRLEEELCWAYQEARRREAVECALHKENTEIRRRAEEAREALRKGLHRVRQIQEQAHSVPALEARVEQLETELHQKRSLCTCMADNTPQPSFPVAAEDACRPDAECLQRAVEGKAASDEEEEEEEGKRPGQMHRGREEAECCLMEVKKLISRLHGCGKGCQRPTVMMMPQGCLHDNSLHPAITEEARACSWKGPNQTAVSRSCGQKKWPEEEKSKLGETERVHLSLLEEKLTAALSLLLELRNKNVSRRALGKILMDTLDMCSSHGNGPSWLLQVADALCVQLSSSELLRDEGGERGESGVMKVAAPSSSHQPPSTNPLLISC